MILTTITNPVKPGVGKLAQVHNGVEGIHFVVENIDGNVVSGTVVTHPCRKETRYKKGNKIKCNLVNIMAVYDKQT